MGESGSGKTTLLNILAALDRPTGGSVFLDGRNLSDIRESDMAAFRRDELGFVFRISTFLTHSPWRTIFIFLWCLPAKATTK